MLTRADLARDPLVVPKVSDVQMDEVERCVCCPLGPNVRLRDAVNPTFTNPRALFTAALFQSAELTLHYTDLEICSTTEINRFNLS